VALGQIAGMLGLEGGGHGTLGKILNDLQQIGETNFYAVATSVIVLAVIVGAKWISKVIPGPLIAVIGATAASWAIGLEAYGVRVLGTVPSGLPEIALPEVAWSWNLIQQLLPTAFAMFVVILAQSAATSRAYAARYNDRFDENTDLIGLGLANVGAGLSGTFVVNGSPTKTQMVDSAGGRSQLSQITTVIIVLLVLLFLTDLLSYMPEAVLSAVVFLIGIALIDIQGMRNIYRQRRSEFWVALITMATVVFIGVEQGILLAMVLSMLDHTRRGYRPKNALVVRSAGGSWQSLPVTSQAEAEPGLMIYRFTHSMYYANAQELLEQVTELVKEAKPSLAWLCIDMSAVDDVDFTAAETLRSLYGILKKRGVRLVFAQVMADLQAESRYQIGKLVSEDAIYSTLDEVVKAYREHTAADGSDQRTNGVRT
jgi:MFS superfamily sulfate permease-like transporter